METDPPFSPVFVAGANGFLGRAIVRSLSTAGYEVRGLVRSPGQATNVVATGGTAVVGDIRDPTSLRRGMEGCRSVIHVAATYPDSPSDANLIRDVRVRGTQNLAASAAEAGARRLLVGSGYWVYADQPGVITDDSPLDPQGESRTNFDAEEAGREAARTRGLEVLVVRPGMVYGDGSWFRGIVDAVRAGTYRVAGGGRNSWSLVDRDDAADAFRSILAYGRSGEAYVVADDAPIALRDLANLVAHELGVASPPEISTDDLRSEVGEAVAHHLTARRAVSNRKTRALGWVPRYPNCRTRLPEVVRAMTRAPS